MTLSNNIARIVDYVINNRSYNIDARDRTDVIKRLTEIIEDGNYCFSIPLLNINYFEGSDGNFPRLYGDAILHHAKTMTSRKHKKKPELN